MNAKHIKQISATIFTLIFLASCNTSIPIRKNESDGMGRMVPGCLNVSNKVANLEYITNSYNTTLGSAFMEGSAAGLNEGLSGQGEPYERARRALHEKVDNDKSLEILRDSIVRQRHYCQSYPSTVAHVTEAIQTILPKLENKIIVSSSKMGVFKTALKHREFLKENPDFPIKEFKGSKWADLYTITVSQAGPFNTDVRVRRDVFISRWDAPKRKYSPYHQGTSNGNNEAWILGEIHEYMNRK